jgi:hypothetical protein
MDTRIDQAIEIAAQPTTVDNNGAHLSAALSELELVMVGGGIGNTIL